MLIKRQSNFLGKKHTAETLKKMSNSLSGDKNPRGFLGKHHTQKRNEKMREIMTGFKRTKQHKEKCRTAKLGSKNPQWKGGITPVNSLIRTSAEYKLWRKSVFERDNYRCIWCKLKGGWSKKIKKQIVLNADHIKPFALYPELRFAIDNGRTLCLDCHHKTNTWGRVLKRQNILL